MRRGSLRQSLSRAALRVRPVQGAKIGHARTLRARIAATNHFTQVHRGRQHRGGSVANRDAAAARSPGSACHRHGFEEIKCPANRAPRGSPTSQSVTAADRRTLSQRQSKPRSSSTALRHGHPHRSSRRRRHLNTIGAVIYVPNYHREPSARQVCRQSLHVGLVRDNAPAERFASSTRNRDSSGRLGRPPCTPRPMAHEFYNTRAYPRRFGYIPPGEAPKPPGSGTAGDGVQLVGPPRPSRS